MGGIHVGQKKNVFMFLKETEKHLFEDGRKVKRLRGRVEQQM